MGAKESVTTSNSRSIGRISSEASKTKVVASSPTGTKPSSPSSTKVATIASLGPNIDSAFNSSSSLKREADKAPSGTARRRPPARANKGTAKTSAATEVADMSSVRESTSKVGSPSELNLMRCFCIGTRQGSRGQLHNKTIAPQSGRGIQSEWPAGLFRPKNLCLQLSELEQGGSDLQLAGWWTGCFEWPKVQSGQADGRSNQLQVWPNSLHRKHDELAPFLLLEKKSVAWKAQSGPEEFQEDQIPVRGVSPHQSQGLAIQLLPIPTQQEGHSQPILALSQPKSTDPSWQSTEGCLTSEPDHSCK